MTAYIFANPFVWGNPLLNVRRLVRITRQKEYTAEDTLVFSASSLLGFVDTARFTEPNLNSELTALKKFIRETKKCVPSVILPYSVRPGVFEILLVRGGKSSKLPYTEQDGALYVEKYDTGLAFDLIFNTKPYDGTEPEVHRSDYVFVDSAAYDDGCVYPGFCKVVKKGKRRANWLSPDGPFDASATHTALCGKNAKKILAMQTALRLYMHRYGFSDVTIGVSGGMDSAFVAALSVKTLGAEHVRLYFLPTIYTSEASCQDAALLAKNLGASLEVFSITPLLDHYVESLGGKSGVALGVLQNLQARIRANILMAHSNADGSLLLSTGNKSESATGYCTLYGDLAGGFNFIGDVFKTDLYELALSDPFLSSVIPKSIFTKAPSAELLPGQKDSDDLPPYSVLDKVLKEILEGRSAEQVKKHFEAGLVETVLRRLRGSQFKREQSCPVLKLSEHPLRDFCDKNFI